MTSIRLINEDGSDGDYIASFEPDIDERGNGELQTTPLLEKAMKFHDAKAAMDFYRQQSKRCPLRDDGRPNRPVTAYTVCFETR